MDYQSVEGRFPLPLFGHEPAQFLDCQITLAHILNTLAEPVFIKDQHHCWRFLNEACCRLFGYPQAALLGKSERDIFQEEEALPFWCAEKQVLETGKSCEHESILTDAEGRPHLLLTKMAVFRPPTGESLLVGIMTDITEHRQHEEQLQRKADRERLLGAIAQNLLKSLHPEQLLQTIVAEVRNFLKADRVIFFSFDLDHEGVFVEATNRLVRNINRGKKRW